MGTRGLLGFIIRGQRFGTFTKFDAYPGGLGRWIVEFILSLSEEQIGEMAQRVREVRPSLKQPATPRCPSAVFRTDCASTLHWQTATMGRRGLASPS
jgi:hypothetical protein